MLLKAILLFVLSLALSGHVDSSADLIREQFDASGAFELESSLPDYVRQSLDRLGVELSEEGIGRISVSDAIEAVADIASDSSKQPVGACSAALGIIILCALGKSLSEVSGNSLATSMETVSTAAVILCVCVPATVFIDTASDCAEGACRFSSILVPVMSGLAAATGHTASAAAYSGFTLAAMETVSVLMSSTVIPGIRVLLAIASAGSFCSAIDLGRLTGAVEKCAKWLLGLLAVTLSGVLGISSLAAAASDNASVRAARFVISGTLPVVGGAISEALGTITNCLGIVRSSVGAFGIAAVVLVVLPAILLALMWMTGLNCTAWAADALGMNRCAAALRSLSAVFSLMLGVIAFVTVLLICSTAMIMALRSV